MPEWDGFERRATRDVCPLHGNIEKKLDQIIDRQITQVQRIEHVQSIVEDGLKATVERIETNLNEVVERMGPIEEFAWFRIWVTDLRNNLFTNSLKLAIIGGGIYAIIHFGDKLFKAVTG